MNRDRLQMVRDLIAASPPERLNMLVDTCGAAHCIGGWANVIANQEGSPLWSSKYKDSSAQDWLGLSQHQADQLFSPGSYGGVLSTIHQTDALAALDSLISAESDDALPVWPVKEFA